MFGGSGLGDDGEDEDDRGRLRRWGSWQRDLWLEPKQSAVARVVDKWWRRWGVLVVLPAALVSWTVLEKKKKGRRAGCEGECWLMISM